ncbi:MAG: MarR family transcriptional regulator [Rhizobiales bacterium]|nr:MarR family transcriptional regulator [Hyphomicrobiales bacterium]
MADIITPPSKASIEAARPRSAAAPGTEEHERGALELMELLFFAYRDFISDPDQILEQYGFGRAHHRVLHFVLRNPGIRVAELLDILKITKQSLGRVLKQLIEEGFIYQREGASDRRQRLLYVTEKGRALALSLAAPQITRIRAALEQSGEGTEERLRSALLNLVNGTEREQVRRWIGSR